MNILIVGFGTAGKYYFNLLKKFSKINKIFVSDIKKIKKSHEYKIINFEISEIKKNKITYAIIASPSNLHYEQARVLIKQNINVLIEKPFTLNLNHAKKLINILKNRKIKCWVVFQNRFNLAIQKLKKIVKKKKIGSIFLVDCSLIWSRDKNYYKVSWRGKYKTDGGVLTNQAIHLLDAVVYIFGNIKKFNGTVKFNKKKLQAEDLVVLNFIHTNNLITSFKATTRADSNYKSSIDVIGDKGRVVVEGVSLNTFHVFKENNKIYDKKNSEDFVTGTGPIKAMGNGHLKILKEFININKKSSSKNLEIYNNIHVLDVIHSVYNSLNKNKSYSKIYKKQSVLGI